MMAEDILWKIEFNRYIENQKREGIEKGIELGQLRTLLSLVKEGLLPLDKAIKKSGLTEKEFKEKLNKL